MGVPAVLGTITAGFSGSEFACRRSSQRRARAAIDARRGTERNCRARETGSRFRLVQVTTRFTTYYPFRWEASWATYRALGIVCGYPWPTTPPSVGFTGTVP